MPPAHITGMTIQSTTLLQQYNDAWGMSGEMPCIHLQYTYSLLQQIISHT